MEKIGLNNNQLKIIAMVTMLIDHVGRLLLPEYTVLTIIGRISYPIFAYMIAEGAYHTRNKLKYFLSVFLLGAGCQIVYWLTSQSMYHNILLSFSLSIMIIYAVENMRKKKNFLSVFLMLSAFAAVLISALIIPIITEKKVYFDYGFFGVLIPIAVYYIPNKWLKILSVAVLLAPLAYFSNWEQWYSYMALPFLALYNGERGKANLKYMFYIFYPAHLGIIELIRIIGL